MDKIKVLPEDEKLIKLHLEGVKDNPHIFTRIGTTHSKVQITLFGEVGVGAFNPDKIFHPSPSFPDNEINRILFNSKQAIAESMPGKLGIEGLDKIEHRRFLVDSDFQNMGLGKLIYGLHNKLSGKPKIEALPYISMQKFYIKEGMVPSKVHLFDQSGNLISLNLSDENADYMAQFICSEDIKQKMIQLSQRDKRLAAKFETPFVLELKIGERNLKSNSTENGFKQLISLAETYQRSRNNLGSYKGSLILPPSIRYPLLQIITSCGCSIPKL